MNKIYEKFNPYEMINIGDIISYLPIAKKVIKGSYKFNNSKIIGICVSVNKNEIEVQTQGIVDINVTGIICIGDQLTLSKIPGIAKAIPYVNQDTTIFKIPNIGKVIGLYNVYDKAKVLLNLREGDKDGFIK